MGFVFEAQPEGEARGHQIDFRDQNGVVVQIRFDPMVDGDEADLDATALSLLDLLQGWTRVDGNGFSLTKTSGRGYTAVEEV